MMESFVIWLREICNFLSKKNLLIFHEICDAFHSREFSIRATVFPVGLAEVEILKTSFSVCSKTASVTQNRRALS